MGLFKHGRSPEARRVFDELINGIKSNEAIARKVEIFEYLKNAKEDILGSWLDEDWYIKQQEKRASERGASYVWLGGGKEEREYRLRILQKLGSEKELSNKFSSLVQELIIHVQGLIVNFQTTTYDYDKFYKNPEHIAKAQAIGKELCSLTKRTVGEEVMDLMQLYILIFQRIEGPLATFLEYKWSGICGWEP
jgi:hypothetical protein